MHRGVLPTIACLVALIAFIPLTAARAQTRASTSTIATGILPDVVTPILSAAIATPSPTACPLLGTVSFNSVDVQPVDLFVGDVVVLTFDVQAFVYSLTDYTLEGADPLLTGYVTITAPNSPTFELHAVQSGTAMVHLRVDYQAERECDGVFTPEYASATSPAYSIVIGEAPSVDTPTPNPTCAATGTPYCSNDCPPPPTHRPGCDPGGGPCIQNPQCASNEVCVADSSVPVSGCCICGTTTPTITHPPTTPTPTPTCAATGTPYCSNHCPPAPTLAPGCFYPGGGLCIQNPQCALNEVCIAETSGQIGGCCACATTIPTIVNTPGTPTPTPNLRVTCVGDCGGTGNVAINDLITLVNIALGNAQPSTCSKGIPNDAEVNIALLVRAVNSALNGCSA